MHTSYGDQRDLWKPQQEGRKRNSLNWNYPRQRKLQSSVWCGRRNAWKEKDREEQKEMWGTMEARKRLIWGLQRGAEVGGCIQGLFRKDLSQSGAAWLDSTSPFRGIPSPFGCYWSWCSDELLGWNWFLFLCICGGGIRTKESPPSPSPSPPPLCEKQNFFISTSADILCWDQVHRQNQGVYLLEKLPALGPPSWELARW